MIVTVQRRYFVLIASVISLIFCSVFWQAAEVKLIDFAEKAMGYIFKRPFNQCLTKDEQGIITSLYKDGKTHYNPLFIASEAQKLDLRRKLYGDRTGFDLYTDWLIDNSVIEDSLAFLYYDFDYPKYKLKAPWASALTQATAMNAIASRAAVDRDVESYLIADKMLKSLVPGTAGLSYTLPDGSIWFMEYPAETPFFALSGMMSTLLQLDKYYQSTHNPLANELFDKGFSALKQLLPAFDYSGYSYYDLNGQKAGRSYHQRHIMLLGKLLDIRNDETLRHYQMRWQASDSRPVIWQMILNPRPKRILAFVFSLAAVWLFIYALLVYSQRKEPDDPEHSSSLPA